IYRQPGCQAVLQPYTSKVTKQTILFIPLIKYSHTQYASGNIACGFCYGKKLLRKTGTREKNQNKTVKSTFHILPNKIIRFAAINLMNLQCYLLPLHFQRLLFSFFEKSNCL